VTMAGKEMHLETCISSSMGKQPFEMEKDYLYTP